jgi:hypothetical protein
LTIEPPPVFDICSAASLVPRKTLVWFTAMIRCQPSSPSGSPTELPDIACRTLGPTRPLVAAHNPTHSKRERSSQIASIPRPRSPWFARHSPLEGAGFEPVWGDFANYYYYVRVNLFRANTAALPIFYGVGVESLP